MIETRGLTKEPNQTLLWAGGSAGSVGASWHFNYVGDTLEALSDDIKVVGFFDSSSVIRLDEYTPLHNPSGEYNYKNLAEYFDLPSEPWSQECA